MKSPFGTSGNTSPTNGDPSWLHFAKEQYPKRKTRKGTIPVTKMLSPRQLRNYRLRQRRKRNKDLHEED